MVETLQLAERTELTLGWGTSAGAPAAARSGADSLHVDRVILDSPPAPSRRCARTSGERRGTDWPRRLEIGADESLRARYLPCDAHVKRIDGDAAIRSK